MIEGVYGYNEDRIMRNRIPLIEVGVEQIQHITYSDNQIVAEFSAGKRRRVEIYADGQADLLLGQIELAGGGTARLSVPLSRYGGFVKPVKVLKVNANLPYNSEIQQAIQMVSNKYKLNL